MAGTFAELVTWPVRAEITLAEVSALLTDAGGVTLTGWAATSGQPNTYERALTNRTAAVGTLGTLYRRVTGVRESGLELAAQTSIANVNATAGSWFWDEAAGVLYVRTSGTAVDPDTRASIAARVTFYLSTAPIVLDLTDGNPATGIYYEPLLTEATKPTHVEEVDDVLSGQKTTGDGEIAAINRGGAWLPIVALGSGYTWQGQTVVVRHGGRYRGLELARSEFQAVATMTIDSDPLADEHVCRWPLRPVLQLADVSIPVTPIFESEYPALGDGVRGAFKPIIYGDVWTRPILTNTAGAGTYTVADAAHQTLFAVRAVEAVTSGGAVVGLTPGVHYTVNLTACTITITDPAFGHDSHTIRARVVGKVAITGTAVVGVRGYLSTFAEIVEDLLRTFAGATSAQIDAAGFATAQADARQELAVSLSSPRALASILATNEEGQASLERSVNATVQQTRGGQWTARVWDPTADVLTLAALRKEDLEGMAPAPRTARTTTAVRVFYAFDGRVDTWAAVERIDTPRRTLTGIVDGRDVLTFLRSPGDAEVLAKRYEAVEAYATRAVDFVERGALLALSSVAERVVLTYAPAPDVTGAYAGRVFALTRLSRGYGPRLAVSGQLRDVDHLTNRVGFWMGAGVPAYASATAAERAASGFWCATAGAPTGFAGSRYW